MPMKHLSRTPWPRHTRTGPSFREQFGADAAEVLASMDRAGDDVPNQTPACRIDIAGVGMRRRGIIVSLRDPFESLDEVNAVCTVEISAGVPATHRGIHTSRIGHVIAETSGDTYRDALAYAETVARAVADTQYGRARVTVHARIPYLEQAARGRPGARKLSLEHLHVIARHAIEPGRASSDIGLRVRHLTACPCVQQTYRHATLAPRSRQADDGAGSADTLMTHSQRCVTTVMAHGVRERVRVAGMLEMLDEVLIRTGSTLPRDDELSVVYRAHRTPQFIEDALRAAALAMTRVLSSPAAFDRVSGQARSIESIHDFDLTARLSLRSAEISGVSF